MQRGNLPTKGPIKAPPLRRPGQSLERQLDDLLFDQVVFWLIFPILFLLIAFIEAYFWFFDIPRMPVLWFVCAVGAGVVAAWRVQGARKRMRNMKQGLEGEVVVGQFLDDLRSQGYRVFHDILEKDGDGTTFNIDHVLIGPGGIFVIETKTRSKPAVGDPIITCEGESIQVNGGPSDPGPIRQARAAASRVKDILQESTGHRDMFIRPVVLFPGWFIEGRPSNGVWVLNPRALPGWLENEAEQLSTERIALYASMLSKHVRNTERVGAV